MKMMGIMRKTTKDKLADIKQAMKPSYTKKYTDVKSRAVSSVKGKRMPLKGGPRIKSEMSYFTKKK